MRLYAPGYLVGDGTAHIVPWYLLSLLVQTSHGVKSE